MLTGKQPIFICIANTGGKKIAKISKDIVIFTSSPPSDLLSICQELTVDDTYSYPLTLTIMVASANAGKAGEGTFFLKVSSTDKSFTLAPLS